MASPERGISHESEEGPASPKEELIESRGSPGDEGAAVESPVSEMEAKKNGKAHGADSDEEGEASDDGEIKDENGKTTTAEEGELEDGEVDEDEEGDQKSKSQICKYYYKGQCTWGSHCRFMHPGYVDKGNYNMFEGLKPQATPTPDPVKQPVQGSGPKVQVSRDLQRPARPRTPPPPLLSLLGLPRLPLVPPDFFPPIPEPPRRETMWEKGVKQARHLAQAAAKKRDAMEDKMHGLADRFDPEFDETARFPPRNGFTPEDAFPPFNVERRSFPVFAARNTADFPARNPTDFDQMSREREIRRHKNFLDQQAQLNFSRNNNNNNNNFDRDRRRSPPANDLRKNLNDVRNQRQRASDEWQDPWMRSRSPGRQTNRPSDRWVRRSGSPRGSRSPKSRSRSGSRVSRTSRVSEASQPKRRSSRRSTRSPKRQQAVRPPSGSPISSTRSESLDSRSHSPAAPPPREERSSPVSSRISGDRGKFSHGGSAVLSGRSKRKHEGSPISSASSRGVTPDAEDDGPRTPPPEETEEDSGAENSQGSFDRRPARRQHSGSPISPEHSVDNHRRTPSPTEPALDEPRAKRLKKGHKPVKMMLQLKADRRNALSALGTEGDDDENMTASEPAQLEHPAKFQHSSSVELDRSSPLSDEEHLQSKQSQGPDIAPDSSDKANKRAELLAQLRAVEEAIARKKATKTTD